MLFLFCVALRYNIIYFPRTINGSHPPQGYKMKNFSRLALVNLIAMSVLSNSTLSYAGQIKHSKSASVTQSSAESIIVNAIKNLKKDIETKNLPVEVAAATFTDSLIAAQVTVSDLDSFVKTSSSAKEYAAFRSMVDLAKNSTPSGELSSHEFGMIASEALKGLDSSGLAWTGCTSKAVGGFIVVGAVVVGIIAATKTINEEKIRSKYISDRSGSQATYDNLVIFHTNRVVNLEFEIGSWDTRIQQNEVQITQYEGLMNNESDPAVRLNYSNKINDLRDSNLHIEGKKAKLKVELDTYKTPGYVQMKIGQATLNFDAETRDSFAAEERAVERIPADKDYAAKLGVAAGVGAALGTYMIISGARDC